MPSVESCKQALRTWILSIYPGTTVMVGEYDGPQPNAPYFSIKLIYSKWYPHSVSNTINDDDEIVKMYVKLFFSIQAIGLGDPQSKLHRLAASFDSIKSNLFFHGEEMGFCGINSNINEISAVVGSGWEDRAIMTANFDARIAETFITEFANAAEIEVIADNGVTEYRETIIVPNTGD